MPYIDWTDDLETGIAFVDQDHKMLVTLLNQVHDTMGDLEEQATLGSVLNSLTEYTRYHFAREEKLQDVAGYPGLAEHQEKHRKLAATVEDVRSRYAADPKSVSAEEMMAFLQSWLLEHIMRQDMAYRHACSDHAEAIAAAEAMKFSDSHHDAAATSQEAAPINWGSLRVLVVEDNKNFQLIIKTILRSIGVRDIVVVGGGTEGLEAVQEEGFDLILSDWRMDGMDGLEFTRALRAKGNSSPIIMMSGYGEEDTQTLALQAGVSAFLEKPITARGFLETAGRLLGGA